MSHDHASSTAASSDVASYAKSYFDPEKLERLQADLGYRFETPARLYAALTHTSRAFEEQTLPWPHQERLEFLGDAILEFVVSDALYRHEDEMPEGRMTALRQLIVREETLAAVAKQLNLGALLLLGHGEEGTGGRHKSSNLEDAMEAIFAAIYRDGGIDAARRVILKVLASPIREALAGRLIYDYKSKLYEYIQASDQTPDLRFDVIREEGPAHQRTFTVALRYHGENLAEASGPTKKQAEQEASREALRLLSDGATRDEAPEREG